MSDVEFVTGSSAARFVRQLHDHGFVVVGRPPVGLHLRRTVGHRDDHVRIDLDRGGWLNRLLQQPPVPTRVHVGQVWQLVEQSFARPVPTTPSIPDHVHTAVELVDLVPTGLDDPDAADAVITWCNEVVTPADALTADRLVNPVLELEFAAVAHDPARGHRAVPRARDWVTNFQGAWARQLARRIDTAVARLG